MEKIEKIVEIIKKLEVDANIKISLIKELSKIQYEYETTIKQLSEDIKKMSEKIK